MKLEKLTKIRKNMKYIIFTIAIILLFIVAMYGYKIKDKQYVHNEKVDATDVVDEDVKVVRQTFLSTKNKLGQIKIQFKLLEGISNNAQLKMKLVDAKTKKVIEEKEVTYVDLKAKPEYTWNFSPIKNSEGNTYEILLEWNHKAASNFGLLYQKENVLENTVLRFDNEKIDGTIGMQLYYQSTTNLLLFIGIGTLLFLIVLVVGTVLLRKKDIKIEKWYLIIGGIIYISYIVLIPTFANHDELYHWFRAYEISEGQMLSGIQDKQALSSLPNAVGDVFTDKVEEINYRSIQSGLEIGNQVEGERNYDMKTVSIYSPAQYMPQAVGIKLANIVTDRPIIMAYMGRVMNAILSIVLVYFAIKLIPFGKKILFAIALFPIAIEGFTSLSPDGITVSMALFFIAYLLNLIFNKQKESIGKIDYCILLGASIILALCKIVYIPLVALCFLLPLNKFKSKKHFALFTGSILLISVVANLGWLAIASKYLALYDSSAGQITSVLYHPFEYIWVLLYTVAINSQGYMLTLVGDKLCWCDLVHVLPIVTYGFLFISVIASLFDKEIKKKMNVKLNWTFAFIACCVVLLIFTSLYVQWTSPGHKVIEGVQGRYFLPILPLVLLVFANIKVVYEGKVNLDKFVLLSCMVLNFSALLSILIYFI